MALTVRQTILGSARCRALITAGLTGLLVAGAAVVAVSANAAAGCRVTYEVPSQWPGGFQANVGITNLGDPINGWRLTWTFPSGQNVTQVWNATITSSGAQVTATNVSYNAAIATNGSVSFGFLGSWAGANTNPTSFALNGVTCTGSVGATTSPTSRPSSTPRQLAAPARRHLAAAHLAAAGQCDGDGGRDAARLEPGQHPGRHPRRDGVG